MRSGEELAARFDAGRLKQGDFVRVRYSDRDDWTNALVQLASDTDPSSVMLLFDGDGTVRTGKGGLIVYGLPLIIDYRAGSVTSLFGDAYEIEVRDVRMGNTKEEVK